MQLRSPAQLKEQGGAKHEYRGYRCCLAKKGEDLEFARGIIATQNFLEGRNRLLFLLAQLLE